MNEDAGNGAKAAGGLMGLLHVLAGTFMAFILLVFGLGIVLAVF